MNRLTVLKIPILFVLFSNCAYYNTFYSAEKSYEDAEKITTVGAAVNYVKGN